VRGELLDVEERKPVPLEERGRRERGEVGVVLVVDRIELPLSNELQEMGKLEGDRAMRREQEPQPRDEIVEVRHVGEHVVADDEVGLTAAAYELLGEAAAEEGDLGRHA